MIEKFRVSNSFKKEFLKNAYKFALMMAFILAYIKIFGDDNTLIGVSIYVGLAMFPVCDTNMKKSAMLLTIAIVFIGSGLVSQLNSLSMLIALPINFIFVYFVMMMTSEPTYLKLNIVMLLPFLFCQSVPIGMDRFNVRMIGILSGTVLMMLATYIGWSKREFGQKDSLAFKEQLILNRKHNKTAIRMATGISIAILISSILRTEKALWVTLVVMSLTQFDSDEMLSRIKYRVIGTVLGSAFFLVAFEYLLPEKYAVLIVLLFGFIGFFSDKYKYKQFINTVSAINASLILFNTKNAIWNRLTGLMLGISIVLILYFIEKMMIKNFRLIRENNIA
ncbi:MAG: FUSC family protein [Peptostreptococcus sp.]|uniref:FUSC family protein n=1 Tax=Peptostreptococcus sp. TaxID=1262 RepID=UPI002FCA8C68